MWAALAMVVHVMLTFDPSIRSAIVRSGTMTEAAAIWSPYGVDLAFDARAADVCLAAFVQRTPVRMDAAHPAVLGSTLVSDDPDAPHAPIRIGFDAVDALAYPSAYANAMLHEYAVAAASGRVLAHEIGHVLLGVPSYHDGTGLMRPTFASSDFTPGDRWRFRLAASSIARLDARTAALTHTVAAACPAQ
jgi:hypothetical protein